MSEEDSQAETDGNDTPVAETALNGRQRSTERKLRVMGRRRLVKTLSALGVSGAALATGQIDEIATAAADDTDDVVRTHSYQHTNHEAVTNGAMPEREAKFYKIPRDQWIRTETAYDAARRVRERIGEIPSVSVTPDVNSPDYGETVICVTQTVVKSVTEDGDKVTKRRPSVSPEEVKRRTPATASGVVEHDGRAHRVEDIPVVFEKNTEIQTEVYSSLYRPVPAGCRMMCADIEIGTIGSPAYDMDNYQSGWLTAAHLFDRQNDVKVHQPYICCETGIGESSRHTNGGNGDIGFIASDGESRKFDFAGKGGNNYMGWTIYGTVAEDKLKDMASGGQTAARQGATTGRSTFDLVRYNDNKGKIIATRSGDKGGDSGGPWYQYDVENDYVLMLGVHRGHFGLDRGRKSVATSMVHAEQELNVVV